MIRHKWFVVAAVISAALMSGAWFLQRETEPAGSVYQQARLFDDVLAHVADYYVDSLDERQLYQMAIEGMLDQLHDPYSVFLKPEDFRQLSEATPAITRAWEFRSTCATAGSPSWRRCPIHRPSAPACRPATASSSSMAGRRKGGSRIRR